MKLSGESGSAGENSHVTKVSSNELLMRITKSKSFRKKRPLSR